MGCGGLSLIDQVADVAWCLEAELSLALDWLSVGSLVLRFHVFLSFELLCTLLDHLRDEFLAVGFDEFHLLELSFSPDIDIMERLDNRFVVGETADLRLVSVELA